MAAMLGFDIEKPTRDLIQEKRHLIRLAAGERIRDELFGILKQPSTAACLEDMADTGLLLALFPEMQGLAELKQNQHHAFDALTHTLKTVDHLEAQLDCLDDILSPKRGGIEPDIEPQTHHHPEVCGPAPRHWKTRYCLHG